MTSKAFILIETVAGKNKEIENELRQLAGVKSADIVTNLYDIILMVEGERLGEIDELVTSKIQPISGIDRTLTCLVI